MQVNIFKWVGRWQEFLKAIRPLIIRQHIGHNLVNSWET